MTHDAATGGDRPKAGVHEDGQKDDPAGTPFLSALPGAQGDQPRIAGSQADTATVEAYLLHLRTQRKLASLTVDSYRRDLMQLCLLMAEVGSTMRLAGLNHFHIRRFAAQLHAKGLDGRSIARMLSAWRGFYRRLAELGRVTSNPVEGVRAPKRGKPLPKALSVDDAVRLVAMPSSGEDMHSPGACCNRAMFELLYSSGLRVSELAALDIRYTAENGHQSAGWIDMEAAEVQVTGKGGKRRSVPVGTPAIDALASWLAVRPALEAKARGDDRMALFLTERGTRMSPRVLQRRIKAHAQALDIPADVHPHMMRHSFASHVLQSSGDLRAVQELLGHASITATQVYTSLDFQRLAQVYDAAHPRAKKK